MTLALIAVALLVALAPAPVSASPWSAFGPETVVRGTGAPTKVTRHFSVLNQHTLYVLDIRPNVAGPSPQGTVSITLNGARVLSVPLSPWVPIIVWPVRLGLSNQLIIELKGSRNDSVSVQVVGLDFDAPTITAAIAPATPASGWFNSNPTVTFTCADRTSGVASCPPPVLVTTEAASQIVSGTVVDEAGNRATASLAVSLDKTAPAIAATLDPAPNAGGWNSGPVSVTFTCSDTLSGIQTCPPPVLVTSPGSQVVTGVAIDRAGNQQTLSQTVHVSTSFFTLRHYNGKCLDAGAGQPGGSVHISTCNGSVGQQFRVEEFAEEAMENVVDEETDEVAAIARIHRRVRLFAGQAVLGFDYEPGGVIDHGSGGGDVVEQAIRLHVPADPTSIALSTQLFVLDGDSIIAQLDRSLVLQVENGRGANGTPVSLRKRHLADAEFWDFVAIDGSDRGPTTGFVRVATMCDLLRYVPIVVPGQPPAGCPSGIPTLKTGLGTVLQVVPGAVLDFSGMYPLRVLSGVTIRGNRRGLSFGPRFCKALECDEDNPMDAPGTGATLEVNGGDVRITGLNLEGPSRSTAHPVPTTRAVLVRDKPAYARTIVDHNDVSGWTGGGIDIVGTDADNFATCNVLPPQSPNVVVARNFLHHNRQQEKGYGVVTGRGGFPLIEGNTFLANRHAIAAAGGGHTGYYARFNLVLSEVPLQDGFGPFNWYTHDFDQHGNGDNGFGGQAGLYNSIFNNTFFGTNRANYELRGQPCDSVDFGGNVSLHNRDDTVHYTPVMILPPFPSSGVVNFIDNHFDSAHPADRLGVGDFDGDGREDLFMATGAAWYFSPGGAREWRYLSGNPAPLASLKFGDFDGDGRTDVVAVGATAGGSKLLVSWGGVSTWEQLNDAPGPITDLAVGQFVSDVPGDRRDDLFWAEGFNWWVSSGGSASFQATQTSSKRVSELRFGDFNGDGLTDIFGIESDVWKVSYGATSTWTALPVSLTDSVAGLLVADFDGDGRADVARASFVFNLVSLSLSSGGAAGWTSHLIGSTSSCSLTFPVGQLFSAGAFAGVARADGVAGADLLLWGAKDNNNFCIVSSGTGAAERWSSQDMR